MSAQLNLLLVSKPRRANTSGRAIHLRTSGAAPRKYAKTINAYLIEPAERTVHLAAKRSGPNRVHALPTLHATPLGIDRCPITYGERK